MTLWLLNQSWHDIPLDCCWCTGCTWRNVTGLTKLSVVRDKSAQHSRNSCLVLCISYRHLSVLVYPSSRLPSLAEAGISYHCEMGNTLNRKKRKSTQYRLTLNSTARSSQLLASAQLCQPCKSWSWVDCAYGYPVNDYLFRGVSKNLYALPDHTSIRLGRCSYFAILLPLSGVICTCHSRQFDVP